MSDDFKMDDLLEEFSCLPDYLHETKEASTWLCQVVKRIRLKQCGREEIAWMLGFPDKALSERLPSSADAGIVGCSLLDVGFLPRGAGCMIQGSKSAAYLNGRKCTLAKDLKDGIDQHALVIVEGGTGEERSDSQEDLRKTIMLARKNLEFASPPDMVEDDGFPSLSLAPEEEKDGETHWAPSTTLGEVWHEPSTLPPYLQSADALIWLTGVVGRLVQSKACGREELAHLLDVNASSGEGFGGPDVPKSLTSEHYGSLLDSLGFVPEGSPCQVEGCRSQAHLNSKVGKLCKACPEGQEYATVELDVVGQLQLHRKNLRFLGAQNGAEAGAGAGTENAAQSVAEPSAAPGAAQTAAPAGNTLAPSSAAEGAAGDVGVLPSRRAEPEKQEAEKDSSGDAWSWWPFNIFCCGGPNTRTCCNGGRAPALAVIQDDFENPRTADSDVVHGELHPSFGPPRAQAPETGGSSIAGDLHEIVQLKVAGNLTESEFQLVKSRLLGAGPSAESAALTDGLRQLSRFKSSGKVTQPEFEAAKRQLFRTDAGGKSVATELSQVLSMREEGFLTEAELAVAKERLLAHA